MPDKKHINDFVQRVVQRVKRLRYLSQCAPVSGTLHGSPGSGTSIGTIADSIVGSSRRRSNSCPGMVQSLLDVSGAEMKREKLISVIIALEMQ